jgi:hypothetical protein
MKCELVNNYIDALNPSEVEHGLNTNIKQHIKTCANCESELQKQLAYFNKMSVLSTPNLSELNAKKLLSNVNKQQKNIAKNDSSFLQGFIAASVLAISVFGAWNLYYSSPEHLPTHIAANEQSDYFVTEVVLVINAPEDMYDADLNITLPQHIALEGYDNTQELTWPVDLKAGENTLSLPIRVNRHQADKQPLSILATLYHYAEERKFEIPVDLNKIKYQSNDSAKVNTASNANLT